MLLSINRQLNNLLMCPKKLDHHTASTGDYLRSAVKIESGAKSALDPHTSATVVPYVAEDLPDLDLKVANVVTARPERTSWDRIIILHGPRQWLTDRTLAGDCTQHAHLFFGSADQGLTTATRGTFTLTPPPAMRNALLRDYEAMAGMVFHAVPPLKGVLASVKAAERATNS